MVNQSKSAANPKNSATIALLVLLAIAVFFRFYNLDKKAFWHDEVVTVCHITGHSGPPKYKQGELVTAGELAQVLTFKKGDNEEPVLKSLASDSQHAPLYYLIAYHWCRQFSTSPSSIRTLSALLGLLQLPAVYWLCIELFKVPRLGLFAACLVGLSPVQIIYAQDAREYSLLVTVTLTLGAVLLRAMREKKLVWWLAYFALLSIGMYVSVLALLAAVSHLIFVLFYGGIRKNRSLIPFLVASFAALLSFLPWLNVIFAHAAMVSKTTQWMTQRIPVFQLAKYWLNVMAIGFMDFDKLLSSPNPYQPKQFALLCFILLFEIGAVAWVCFRPKKIRLFLLPMIFLNVLVLVIPDLVFGGVRCNSARYSLQALSYLSLCSALLIYSNVARGGTVRRAAWLSIAIVLVGCQISSDYVSAESETWMPHTVNGQRLASVAAVLNNETAPVIVFSDMTDGSVDVNYKQLIALSPMIKPQIKIQLFRHPVIPHWGPQEHAYFFNTSKAFNDNLHTSKMFELERVGDMNYLSRAKAISQPD
jgi:uncharacterized membrane protein